MKTGKRAEERVDGAAPVDTVRKSGSHPSTNLEARRKGFGIGGGYERPITRKIEARTPRLYGPVPHSGYYGSGNPVRRFSIGQAGFTEEAGWFEAQFGETTSAGNAKKDQG